MRLFRWMLFLLLVMTAAGRQTFDPDRDVSILFSKGSLRVSVPAGAHLKKAFLQITPTPGAPGRVRVGKLPVTNEKDELGDPVYHGSVAIPIHGEGLKGEIELKVTYQPCTEGEGGVCYPPTERLLKIKASEIAISRKEVPAAITPAPRPATARQAPTAVPPPPVTEKSGLLWTLLVTFCFGVLASLTPCVYPMIPITMAVIGAKGGGRAKGFTLSLALVLGMAVTYTLLGVFAARTGAAFGAAAQRPAFLIPVSLLFALFALSLFGAFEIRLPEALQSRLQGGPRKGLGGAFLMGLVLGPLSAPCVGPVIGTILLAIAQQGQVWWGALQLFVFSLGMGVLFMAVGTFTAALPRSGDWLVRLKEFMGLVVLAFAVWNLRFVLPPWASYALWSLTLLIGAAILGVFKPSENMLSGIQKGLGVLALALALLLGIRGVEMALHLELLRGPQAQGIQTKKNLWMEQDLEGALARAKAEKKPVLVDVYADWCAQCKELDEKTWPNDRVQSWVQNQAIAVRIDTDRVRRDLAPRLGIQGYPTVLLLDAEGHELRRAMGFLGPEAMLAFLEGRPPA